MSNGIAGFLDNIVGSVQDRINQGQDTPEPQLPAYNNYGRLDSFYQSPFYTSMPDYAYMPAGLKQDNKDDDDDTRYAQLASEQAANMRSWNNYLDRVHMEYLNSMVPNYETQQYDYVPSPGLLAAYSEKPELKRISSAATWS